MPDRGRHRRRRRQRCRYWVTRRRDISAEWKSPPLAQCGREMAPRRKTPIRNRSLLAVVVLAVGRIVALARLDFQIGVLHPDFHFAEAAVAGRVGGGVADVVLAA